jgi:hypothetical protein
LGKDKHIIPPVYENQCLREVFQFINWAALSNLPIHSFFNWSLVYMEVPLISKTASWDFPHRVPSSYFILVSVKDSTEQT